MLAMDQMTHDLGHRYQRPLDYPFWTLEYLHEGRERLQIGGCRHDKVAPTLTLLAPGTSSLTRWGGGVGPWSELFAIFDVSPSWVPLLAWPPMAEGVGELSLAAYPETRSAIVHALHEGVDLLRSARPNRLALARNALERILLLADEINPMRAHGRRDCRLREVLDYIASHLAERMNVESLADMAHLSASRFAYLFKAQMGVSVMAYVETARLERAAERLLRSGDSIGHIAAQVGFDNAMHFSTRFRLHFGQPPSRYRRQPAAP